VASETLDDRFERGVKFRTKVLGAQHVQNETSEEGEFELKKFLGRVTTEFVWGTVWCRPQLELKIRCLVTLAMNIALQRTRDIRLHMAGALRNGASQEEICEVILQSGVYCGMPTAQEVFKIAKEVFKEFKE
jgi:4-carboxymuconolactone decarboxylase